MIPFESASVSTLKTLAVDHHAAGAKVKVSHKSGRLALDVTYLQSLHNFKFKFLSLELVHEMTLELVPGANFRCVLHHFSRPTRWSGSWGQVWPKKDRKTKLKLQFLCLGMIATKLRLGELRVSILCARPPQGLGKGFDLSRCALRLGRRCICVSTPYGPSQRFVGNSEF